MSARAGFYQHASPRSSSREAGRGRHRVDRRPSGTAPPREALREVVARFGTEGDGDRREPREDRDHARQEHQTIHGSSPRPASTRIRLASTLPAMLVPSSTSHRPTVRRSRTNAGSLAAVRARRSSWTCRLMSFIRSTAYAIRASPARLIRSSNLVHLSTASPQREPPMLESDGYVKVGPRRRSGRRRGVPDRPFVRRRPAGCSGSG